MAAAQTIGLFGKLPAHGDFVHRNLPTNLINIWDEWLQQFIAGSQEQLGDAWLDIYLTSPIWRFVLSPGVIDERIWLGIIMPSVDRVGRYFPFSVIMPITAQHNPLMVINTYAEWFESVEQSALLALDGQCGIDSLMEQVHQIEYTVEQPYLQTNNRAGMEARPNAAIVLDAPPQAATPIMAMPYLLNTLVTQSMPSYSVWSTLGSEWVTACLFVSPSLPPINGIAAMLDGQWSERGWQQPYVLADNP